MFCTGKREIHFWVNYLGEETTQPSSEVPTVDDVVNGGTFALEDLQFRDPNRFVAGNLMSCAKTLQRFAGKCVSLYLAIPSARLFSREVNRAISLSFY